MLSTGIDPLMRKHIKIIVAVEIALTLLMMGYTLSKSQYVGEFAFRYLYNQNTGERLSVIASLGCYAFFWFVLGMLPGAIVFLVGLFVYGVIHRKDKRLLERHYSPPYWDELQIGGGIGFFAVFVSQFVLVILHVSGLFEIVYPFAP